MAFRCFSVHPSIATTASVIATSTMSLRTMHLFPAPGLHNRASSGSLPGHHLAWFARDGARVTPSRQKCRQGGGGVMGIGVGLFLLAAGAILTFAVDATVNGVDIQTVGV